MPQEFIIQFMGEETVELVKGKKPHQDELNALTKKILGQIGSDNINEAIIKLFDFMVDPASEAVKEQYRKYKLAAPANKPVVVFEGKGKNRKAVRRFPHRMVDGEIEYMSKSVNYAGVKFNFTGKILDDGSPEYIARCSFDQWNKIRNQKTQIEKLPMYVEVEEIAPENDPLVQSLINNAVSQALEKFTKPEPEPAKKKADK